MSAAVFFRSRPVSWLCLVAFLSLLLTSTASAAELNIEATLIWGANDEKSPNPKHKPVDPELAKKLGKIFKWKYYFEVNRQAANVPSRGNKKLRMSDKCDLDITELEGPKIEVKLIGEGKPVNKTTKTLTKGESIIISGSDKNDCSWFVIIKLVDEK